MPFSLFRRFPYMSHVGLAILFVGALFRLEFQAAKDVFRRETNSLAAIPVPHVNTTLVIITGSLRSGEKAWRSLYENVLDINMADLAVITDDAVPEMYKNSSLFQRARYVWTVHNYNDWADALDIINDGNKDWREPLFSLYQDGHGGQNSMLGGLRGVPGSGAIIFSFRWFLAKYIRELGLTEKYNRFVVTRSDQYYLCKHDISTLDPQFLWVPRGEDYRGITDRHFVANNRDILTALDILPPLLKNATKYFKQLTKPVYNPERFLLHRWAQEGLKGRIRRFDRMMFISANLADTSRWGPISEDAVKEGVHIKYPQEYMSSVETCSNDFFITK